MTNQDPLINDAQQKKGRRTIPTGAISQAEQAINEMNASVALLHIGAKATR